MFFILERIFFSDSWKSDRSGGESQHAQVIFFDCLIGVCLRISCIQPLQFLYVGISCLRGGRAGCRQTAKG